MKRLTKEQERAVVQQWKRAGPELERVRREELAAWKYDPTVVDALLEIGANSPYKEEEPNSLVLIQKVFIEYAMRKGLLPARVRERMAEYGKALNRKKDREGKRAAKKA